MTERTIARRYVRALFELALEQNDADGVLGELERATQKLASEPALAAALFDPRAGAEGKRESVNRLLPAAARAVVRDFAYLLVDRGRESVLPLAAGEFAEMLREQRGEAVADVVSAAPLASDARAALVAKLQELTKKRITLNESIDATLVGGMRVRVGSMLLDGSVKRRLVTMRDELMRVALPR